MNLKLKNIYRFLIIYLFSMTTTNAFGNGVVFFELDEENIRKYSRERSEHDILYQDIKDKLSITAEELNLTPIKSRGAPGVGLIDYDNDGDVDIYVTNGPGTPNSLYSNQFIETGRNYFIDVAKKANVEIIEKDSSGVCFGDIDNDNDIDLYVLSVAGHDNTLLENQGNGTFKDITASSRTGGQGRYSPSCSMGDIDNDGFLDIAVANNGVWDDQLPLNIAFDLNQHNQLFKNTGNNTFIDVSAESGFETNAGFPEGAAGFTWAISMVDYDQDGDIDIITGDDQGSVTPAALGGVDSGVIHIFENDGNGNFVDVNAQAGVAISGLWMGFAFGDLNADGYMDFFASNIGDYMPTNFFPSEPGPFASRWFLGQRDKTFVDAGVSNLIATSFGWGALFADYDNDADLDIFYHGGLDAGPFIEGSNPGLVLKNDGLGNFIYDTAALSGSVDHARRTVQGFAAGDLNNDGFIDLVSVSNIDIDHDIASTPYFQHGADIDHLAVYFENFTMNEEGNFEWTGHDFSNGSLVVEINSGNDTAGHVSINAIGTKGITTQGSVNRSAVGAVVGFTPKGKARVIQPITAGSSYASHNSFTSHFGMADADFGVVDVLWPGGVKNKLYGVKSGDRINLPEIPCSYEQGLENYTQYYRCVKKSLKQLRRAKVVNRSEAYRLKRSAILALLDYNYNVWSEK